MFPYLLYNILILPSSQRILNSSTDCEVAGTFHTNTKLVDVELILVISEGGGGSAIAKKCCKYFKIMYS